MNGIDTWRELFPKVAGFTHKAARLDYFLTSRAWFEEVKESIILLIGHEEDSSSDHVDLSMSVPILASSQLLTPWSVRSPRISLAARGVDVASQILSHWRASQDGNWTFEKME